MNAAGGFVVQGATDSTIVISNFGASGTVLLTYEYKAVPAPGTESISTVPPCSSVIFLTTCRPSPVPPAALVEKKRL